jgi:hypothetical protein
MLTLLGTGALILFLFGLVVWPDVSCENFLTDFIADRLHTSGYTFRAFTNNITPGTGDVLGSYTEGAWTGYASVAGSTITWGTVNLVGHIAQTTGSAILFNNTSGSPVTLYGVYVTDAGNTKLYFAERDPNAPVSIPAGGSYAYIPNQQFKSIN